MTAGLGGMPPPPLNAPAGQQATGGVQPGQSNAIVVANKVIVFGPGDGVFVYNGVPAPGNPPIFSVSGGTVDPYGNTISAGIWAGQFGSAAQAGLAVAGGIGELQLPVTGVSLSVEPRLAAGLLGSGAVVEWEGPGESAAGISDYFYQLLYSHSVNGTSATWFVTYIDALGGNNTHIQADYRGTVLNVANVITAVKPGSGTSATAPAVPETWHSMTLGNGWANVAGFRAAQYRKTAFNEVEIIGAINAAAATSGNFFDLPAGYQPVNQQPACSLGASGSVGAGLSPWVVCAASGALSVQNTGAVPGAWQGFFHGFITLDA